MVGHSDLTPSFARLEDGRVLVEVTLQPSGEEIIAACPPDLLSTPIRYGEQVLVAQPGGGCSLRRYKTAMRVRLSNHPVNTAKRR